jgi:hypothetical protein
MNESELEITNLVLENVLEYSTLNPRDLTHVAIGSCPRYQNLKEFTPEIDQLIPQFMVKEIQSTNKTIRIIHIDSFTERYLSFLHEYFKGKSTTMKINFKHNDSEGINIWTSDDHRIEIIFLFVFINHTNNRNEKSFLEKMIDSVLNNNNKLIVQEYTGYELANLFKMLYQNNSQKDLFKNNILFDVTYGEDCHCMTNMTKFFPKYKSNGTFYNFLLYNFIEMRELIGIDQEIDNIIKVYFLKEYYNNIEQDHLNYRRVILNINHYYTQYESADDIMNNLIDKIKFIISIFELLKLVTDDKKEKINDLLMNYKSYDVYKWREHMLQMFR